MTRQSLTATCLLITASGLVGCASQTTTAEDKAARESEVVQEAPLGSRIKKKTKIAPVSEATRQDVENARVQQGMQQTGAVNRAGSN